MFTATLFTTIKSWKQPKCPLTNEWIKKMQYIYTQNGILLSHQKSEIVSLASTQMDLEIIIPNEVSQKDKYHMISLIGEI